MASGRHKGLVGYLTTNKPSIFMGNMQSQDSIVANTTEKIFRKVLFFSLISLPLSLSVLDRSPPPKQLPLTTHPQPCPHRIAHSFRRPLLQMPPSYTPPLPSNLSPLISPNGTHTSPNPHRPLHHPTLPTRHSSHFSPSLRKIQNH
ncbi:hypothetical protein GBA52_000975 [Prunus armeniaca]|nr:hypothetical protein GBA52_000975 [Prunus armeniaca]